jgi:hypothetical protein
MTLARGIVFVQFSCRREVAGGFWSGSSGIRSLRKSRLLFGLDCRKGRTRHAVAVAIVFLAEGDSLTGRFRDSEAKPSGVEVQCVREAVAKPDRRWWNE